MVTERVDIAQVGIIFKNICLDVLFSVRTYYVWDGNAVHTSDLSKYVMPTNNPSQRCFFQQMVL